jgi:glutathione S-transferase
MRQLYHFPLCPFSRKVRIALSEKLLDFELVLEKYWERRAAFATLNPAMQVPVLVEEGNKILPDSVAIVEYLEQTYPTKPLLGLHSDESFEIRRLCSWFDHKFFIEVTRYLMMEKVILYYTRVGSPSSDAIRAAKYNVVSHMEYLAFLMEDRKWLAGDRFTLADIAAASHLSVLDYLNETPWEYYPAVKEWYALVKSRPSFRALLKDKIPGFAPSKQYADLDF